MDILLALGIFVISMALVLGARRFVGKDYEIKNSDVMIGIVPLALWLILSGKISSIEYGDLRIVTAFRNANEKQVSGSVTDIYRSDIIAEDKGSIYELERVLRSKPEALTFYAGAGRYDVNVFREYIDQLSKSTLRFLVIKERNRQFLGIVSVNDFLAQVQSDRPPFSVRDFVGWLNSGNALSIKGIRGMVTVENALPPNASKQTALAEMIALNSKFIPVVNNGEFEGILEMDRLSTSLLMDISAALEE